MEEGGEGISLTTLQFGTVLAGFLNFPGAEAASTNMDIAGGSVDEGVDSMSIGKLSPFGHVVGVADTVGYHWTLSADLAPTLVPGHPGLLPILGIAALQTRKIVLKVP